MCFLPAICSTAVMCLPSKLPRPLILKTRCPHPNSQRSSTPCHRRLRLQRSNEHQEHHASPNRIARSPPRSSVAPERCTCGNSAITKAACHSAVHHGLEVYPV